MPRRHRLTELVRPSARALPPARLARAPLGLLLAALSACGLEAWEGRPGSGSLAPGADAPDAGASGAQARGDGGAESAPSPGTGADAGTPGAGAADAGHPAGGADDAGRLDGGASDADAGTSVDGGTAATSDAGSDAGTPPLPPGAKLVIEQLELPGAVMSEATLIVGPDGTSALVDVGSSATADRVLAALERRVGARAVDWVVLTHMHGDHLGGFSELFTPSSLNGERPVEIRRGLVWRGPFDLEADVAKDRDFAAVCRWAAEPRNASRLVELCEGSARPVCGERSGEPWPARSCEGLRAGESGRRRGDGAAALTYLELGGGARMTFFAANGFSADGVSVTSLEADGVELGAGGVGFENSRSLAGLVRWGRFDYVFSGDLTGGGKEDAPDVETVIARRASAALDRLGGRPVVSPSGADVVHLSHHGTRSSTNQAWVDWLLPADGRARNAVSGANNGYWGAPAQVVLDRVLPRLFGGAVWMTDSSFGAGRGARLRALKRTVVFTVEDDGERYRVGPQDGLSDRDFEVYQSTPP